MKITVWCALLALCVAANAQKSPSPPQEIQAPPLKFQAPPLEIVVANAQKSPPPPQKSPSPPQKSPSPPMEIQVPPLEFPLARIDPQALRLLSQLSEKYESAWLYRDVTEIRVSEKNGANSQLSRFRVALSRSGQARITRADSNTKNIFQLIGDGRQVMTTQTRSPRQYTLEKAPILGVAWQSLLAQANYRGAVARLLDGSFGQILLAPDLAEVALLPETVEKGETLRGVVFRLKGRGDEEIKLWIAPDNSLRRSQDRLVYRDGAEETVRESHSEVAFARQEPNSAFQIVIPRSFKRVETFAAASVSAKAPVDLGAVAK